MSYFKAVMQTKEAKEAVGEGLLRLIETKDLDKGIDAMLKRGNHNGSASAVLVALILDAVESSDRF